MHHTQRLGLQQYEPIYRRMREFTLARTEETPDELWFLEHEPVFTQGQAGKAEHVLSPGAIPVVQSDRGGQVTYHGPGQLMGYVLVDLQRLGYGIEGAGRRDQPGVYVGERKIASLGLRVRKGRTYHGLALNVAMDLEPFARINPCGFRGLEMTQVAELGGPAGVDTVARDLEPHLARRLGLNG